MENVQVQPTENKPAELSWVQRQTLRSLHNAVLHAIEKHSFDEPRDLLNIGAGPGDFLQAAQERFPKLRLIGVEAEEAMVRIAVRRVQGAHLYVAQPDELPLYPESVDVAVSIGAYRLWSHPMKCIRELLRVLRPGGLLLLASRYEAKELHHALKAEGFQVLQQPRHWPSQMRITIAKKRG